MWITDSKMTTGKQKLKDRRKFIDTPYKDLYIYYLEGRLKSNHKIFHDHFIGNWQEDEFSFLFFSRPAPKEVGKILRSNPGSALLEEFHMTYDQWQGDTIAPFKIGRFHIIPPWEKPSNRTGASSEDLTVLLDPGVVFGNGLHSTTQDCLEALEMVFLRENIASALDLGTGTGLLSLAVSLLGCETTLAVDVNFLAANTALRNVRLNGLENTILVAQGRAEDFIDSPSDLMIANIHYEVMKQLITAPGFLKKKWFILSGLLRSQARDLRFKLSRLPIRIIKEWSREDIWHTFLAKKG
jgi:ribosomal protein L11 methyltransferase